MDAGNRVDMMLADGTKLRPHEIMVPIGTGMEEVFAFWILDLRFWI
jgi:hypothetical protein